MNAPARMSRVGRGLAAFAGWVERLVFMHPGDIGLFVRSARTDGVLARARATAGARAAFEAAYSDGGDPWSSAAPCYRYQRRKYRRLVALLPPRRFTRALDLGCGLGLLSQLLAPLADTVLGLDLAAAAVTRAAGRARHLSNVAFAQGDVLALPRGLDGTFDLVVIADTLYYLSPLGDELLKALACRIADLLMPGGVCLIANHFFFAADPDSRVTRRIHRAFAWSPRFAVIGEYRRPFYLAALLREQPAGHALAATPNATCPNITNLNTTGLNTTGLDTTSLDTTGLNTVSRDGSHPDAARR